MGLPFFSWKPHMRRLTPTREWIYIPEVLTDLQITHRRDVVDSYSYFGGRHRENLRTWIDIRVQLDRFTSRDLFLQFRGLIDHLERGGSCMFGNDLDKLYMSTLLMDQNQGVTNIKVSPNKAKSFLTTAPDQLAAGDEIVIESYPPKAAREYQTVASHSASEKITFASSRHLFDDYAAESRVRHADFWPTLILGAGEVGSAMLTHDRRMNFTFDMQLSYVLPVRSTPQSTAQGTDTTTSGGDKPDSGSSDGVG